MLIPEPMSEANAGYRLDYLEFYNWGTFDGRTSRISPGGQSSLMTGANGSGKTTVVDALLTLLVPTQKRFYNQSSGAEQKKDRSEESYMLGEIGKTREDEDQEARKKYLRPDKLNTVSFLLGCFYNPETGGYVTLVQARWFSTTELKRTLIVSPHKLSIDHDVMPFDKHGDWRKRLKNTFAKTEITDSFGQYSQEFIRLFNMRSEKALTLFNQTVGIKVLGNLNDFIRTHMLEDGEQEKEFEKLRANYLDLLETYNNLQKAEEQIRLLAPVVETCNAHDEIKKRLGLLENIKDALPFYFAGQEVSILETLVADTRGELRQQEELIQQKEHEKLRKQEALEALQSSIAQNKASEAISKIEGQISSLKKDLNRKHEQATAYDVLAEQSGYDKLISKEIFEVNRKRVETDLKEIEAKLEINQDEAVEKKIQLQQTSEDLQHLDSELQSLRNRKNRIPLKNITLRQRMLEALGLDVDEIPFAGELIRVKQEEREWESAIERLVKSFGLRLLVPEKHLRAVNAYVIKTQLRGRIVYDRIYNLPKSGTIYHDHSTITLRDKIDIKDDSALFSSYLENQFSERFNHICAETQEEFERAKRALMISGLSKNGDRHEKDDSTDSISPDKFILGWDNKEQIHLLESNFRKLEHKIGQIQWEIAQLKQENDSLNRQKERIQKLQHYANYQELNWQDDEATIKELARQKEKLSRESGIKELMAQRDETKQAVETLGEIINKEIEKKGKLKERIEKHEASSEELGAFIQSENYEEAKNYFDLISPYIKEAQLSDPLKKIQAERKQTHASVEEELKKKLAEQIRTRDKVIRYMSAFTSPVEEIRKKYADWSKDTTGLTANLEYANDFRKLYERITIEDLPKHKTDFKEYMKDSVTSRITSFKTGLDNRQEEIEEHIEQLNKSLHKIDFSTNPHTYIQLRSKLAKDIEIRTFKGELTNCIVPAADIELAKSDDWIENAFLKIRDLIEKLHNDKDKRKKLIDVRNWMDFEAEEFFREDNKRRKTLDSSDSLSGGEKAQFTYTVLGAAIAFQFGISESNTKTNSFRFIAVDEAFSKLDPEKSHYLMALCRQLHLQILVVTPLDKIYVAEEYISSCHFVEKQSTDRSKVYNLTMPQYYEQKKQWEAKSHAN